MTSLTDEGLMRVPGMLSRWVRLPGGVRAHYMTSGSEGPAVVLLHGGMPGSSGLAGWRLLAPYLGERGFRVYCPDMPGFGLTSDPNEFYVRGEPGHVDFLHDLLTALCLDDVRIAGNSMGCKNAVNYLLAHPERVACMALIAGSIGDIVPDRPEGESLSATRSQNRRAFDGTPESMAAALSRISKASYEPTDDLVAMRTLHANAQMPVYSRRLEALDTNAQARLRTAGRLNDVDVPLIYVYGQDDVLIPAEDRGYRQEDALPNAQFFYPERCGHQAQTDRPDLVNPLLAEFFGPGLIADRTARAAGMSERRPRNTSIVAAPADATINP